jgi:hypothetical protein
MDSFQHLLGTRYTLSRHSISVLLANLVFT